MFHVAKVACSAYYAPGARVFKDDVVICHVEDLNDPLLGQVFGVHSVDDAECICLKPMGAVGKQHIQLLQVWIACSTSGWSAFETLASLSHWLMIRRAVARMLYLGEMVAQIG